MENKPALSAAVASNKAVVAALNRQTATMDEAKKFVYHMTRREFNQLGFVPITRLMQEMERGNVQILRKGGEVIGYIYASPRAPVRRIYQLAVRDDARRKTNAQELLKLALGDTPATLRCAADIPGEQFWRAIGFQEVKRERPHTCRKREIITFARGNTFPLLGGARILPVEFPVITPEKPTTLQAAPSPLIL